MSISVVVDVHCDCNVGHEGHICGWHTDYSDSGTVRKGALRKKAREDGWRYYKGKDMCPGCVRSDHAVQFEESL